MRNDMITEHAKESKMMRVNPNNELVGLQKSQVSVHVIKINRWKNIIKNLIPWLFDLQNQYKTMYYLDQMQQISPNPNDH